MSSQAIFLDRDGVIIENRREYVRAWNEVQIFPEALQALAALEGLPYKTVIVTNQSAIGRGLLAADQADEINRRLIQAIEAAGGKVDGLFVCPHAPEQACECRKPLPGLLFQAQKALDLDLPQSILIGDALTDLQAGRAAGVGALALIRTGRGREQEALAQRDGFDPNFTFENLAAAFEALLAVRSRQLK